MQEESIDEKDKPSEKNSEVDIEIIDEAQEINFRDPFSNLKKNTTNLFNENVFSDDQFKLPELKNNKKISIARLSSILKPGTRLFGPEIKDQLQTNYSNLPHWPNFIPEMHMLPAWHFHSIIEPSYVNEQGFYHVVVVKEGRLVKETIDDTFYYDEGFHTIYCDEIPETDNFRIKVWMHIILKTWAKLKGSYSNVFNASPFEFVKTFSYPDWVITNPVHEIREKLITHLNPIEKKETLAIAKTKNSPTVGVFGLIPNSASYVITGHVMEYEAIFIKIRTLTGSKWNGKRSSAHSPRPEDEISLQENQFSMPIDQFLNLFHLIYSTSDKFSVRSDIFYNRYSLNLDARQSKAKMLTFDVCPPSKTHKKGVERRNSLNEKQPEYSTNLTIYFPSIRSYDIANERTFGSSNEFKSQKDAQQQDLEIPYCKLLIGLQSETSNLEASFVESMKEKMLDNEDGDFLCVKANVQFNIKEGTYFKGYDNSVTFLMKLKPGKYFLRFKIETLRIEYRANINLVSETEVKISDPKMDKQEQEEFLKEILSSKARLEKRNLGYLNPIKKGSWFICNDDFTSIGYGYVVVQTRKSSDFKVELNVDPKVLREYGYRVKGKKDQKKYSITLVEGQGDIIILKLDENFDKNKTRIWPPPGIELIRLWNKQ